MPLQARGVGEQVDLLRVAGAREEEELLAAGVLEGGEVLLDGLGVLRGGAGDEVGGVLAEPGVIVGQVGPGVLSARSPREK
jgi:hypothetical protein